MSASLSTSGDAGGMLRSRKYWTLLLVCAFVAATLYILGHRKPSELDLLDAHYAQRQQDTVVEPGSAAHPIHLLITEAEEQFQLLRAKQSGSLKEAVTEYWRRYGMPPPPHFDKWYNFATQRGVVLIDEYNTIYDSLLPFWALEPSVIRERTREAIGYDNALISLMIRNGKITKLEGGGDMYQWHREATPIMLNHFLAYLPDMDLAFNIHDEPRVVVPHDKLSHHIHLAKERIRSGFNATKPRSSFSARPLDLGEGNRIKEYKTTRFNNFAHQSTWADSRLSCGLDSPVRGCFNDSCPDDVDAYSDLPLGFIRNTTAFSDICNSPSMEKSFGFFDRPNAFDVTHELFPIFSQSKVSSFQDIVYPSPWYYMYRVRYDEEKDMDWEAKKANMYWRGSTTGGFSRDGGWRRQHRQRFLQKIEPLGQGKVLKFDNSTQPGLWHQKQAKIQDFAHYFDVKFTYIGQCDPGDCDAQKEYFDVVEPVNMFDALGSKFLLDIDGNAFSGRYYAWLLSKSLVYKLALFREWHDEWLRPWVHYIPLGLQGDEYLEAVRYFDEEEQGRTEAKLLADTGRAWAQKVLRNEDLEVWYFRLLLE